MNSNTKKIIRALVGLLAIAGFALPASAGIFGSRPVEQPGVFRYPIIIPTTAQIDDFSNPIPACKSMIVYWERGNSAVVSAYPADSDDDTVAEIEANTLIRQFTTSERYEITTPTKAYVRFVVDTVNATVPSKIQVVCADIASSGAGAGGVSVITQDSLASPGAQNTIYQVIDATTATDCATGTPGSAVAYCGWTGSAYTSIGVAGGTDNLGNHLATTTLDLASNPLDNIGAATFKSTTVASPQPSTVTATSPSHVIWENLKYWFKIDGQKGPVQGEGGSIVKTKTAARETEFVNLTKSEGYGAYEHVWGGGDTDLVGFQIDTFGTGGSQADGDEGYTGIRQFLQDYWLTAIGTVGAAVTSGAGTQTVALANITEAESKMLGENKWAVFTELTSTVEVADIPIGVMNSAGAIEDSGWSSTTKGTQGQFTLAAGSVASVSGLASTGWCFAGTDSVYNDINGQATYIWLPIVNVAGEVITTRWQNQGYDAGTPYQYITSEGAGEGKIAPCALVDQPNFTTGSDFIADTITLVKGAGFPGAGSSSANDEITVAAYPGIRNSGVNTIMAKKLGGMYASSGYMATNLIDGGNLSGRYQLSAAFDPGFSNDINQLKDGTHFAWLYGLDCGSPGDCEYGNRYAFPDTVSYPGTFALLNLGNTVAATLTHNVFRIEDYYEESLAFDHDGGGWGQGISTFSPFVKRSDVGTYAGDVYDVGGCPSGSCYTTSQGNADTNALFSQGAFSIYLDEDANASSQFNIKNDTGGNAWSVTEAGVITTTGEQFVDRLGFEFETGSTLSDCTTFASGGGFYYDSTNSKFKKCQGGVLSDLDTGGSGFAADTTWAAAGDLAYATGNDTGAVLSIGSAGQVLRSTGTAPAWGDLDPDFVVNDATNDDFLDVASGGTGAGTFTSNALLKGAGTGDLVASGVSVDSSNNVSGVGTLAASGAITAPSFLTSDYTVEPGNLIQFNDNDTAFTNDPTCANSGVAGTLTLIDKDESSADDYVVCDGTTELGSLNQFPELDQAETIAGNWVNTANPWADNEVVDTITASNYLPLAGGTTTGAVVVGSGSTLRPSGTGVVEATEVDASAGAGPTANGAILYDSTANDLEYGDNGTNRKVANLDEAQTLSSKTLASPVVSGTASGNNTLPSAMITTERRTLFAPLDELEVDGTNCVKNAAAVINSGPKMQTITCADNDASVIYGKTKMPDSWDTTAQINLIISGFSGNASDTGDIVGTWTAMCRGVTENIDNTWATPVTYSTTSGLTGTQYAYDQVTGASITPNGTCAAGDMLFWKATLTASTTTAVMTDFRFMEARLEYVSNVGD